jgi:hypothetical protein
MAENNQPCIKRSVDKSIALTENAISRLRNKVDKKLTLFDQWYQVWDAIFPGAPRPATCTIDPELSEALNDLYEFFHTHGSGIVLHVLERNNLIVNSHSIAIDRQDTEALALLTRQVLSTAFQEIFDVWRAKRQMSSIQNGDGSSVGTYSPLYSAVQQVNRDLEYGGGSSTYINTPGTSASGGTNPDVELRQSSVQIRRRQPQLGIESTRDPVGSLEYSAPAIFNPGLISQNQLGLRRGVDGSLRDDEIDSGRQLEDLSNPWGAWPWDIGPPG